MEGGTLVLGSQCRVVGGRLSYDGALLAQAASMPLRPASFASSEPPVSCPLHIVASSIEAAAWRSTSPPIAYELAQPHPRRATTTPKKNFDD
jgi:hypothetical protein